MRPDIVIAFDLTTFEANGIVQPQLHQIHFGKRMHDQQFLEDFFFDKTYEKKNNSVVSVKFRESLHDINFQK